MEDSFKVPSLDLPIKFIPRNTSSDKKASTDTIDPGDKSIANKIPTENSTQKPNPKQKPKIVYPKCTYVEPAWSEAPNSELTYSIEVLKNGQIVETIPNLQTKPYWLLGKLPDNHIVMAHPTISRYHAVLQYRPEVIRANPTDSNEDTDGSEAEPPKPIIQKGWYLYDMNSTHGTFVNKNRIPPKTYVRIRVGYMLKFGGSTRRLILQGPDFDAEAESDMSITEMRAERARRELEAIEKRRLEDEKRLQEEAAKEAAGITWGMSEDADAETDLSINPFATTNNEELFLNDPKKTLRGYFEREGLDLEYKVDEMSAGSFVCRIELPIHDAFGRAIVAEVCHKGKKKDCVHQCALEACRMLDRNGVLRQANHESRKRKVEHSDSDGDDDFYDRTGAVERKRTEKSAMQQNTALSYAELMEQESEIVAKLEAVYSRIEKYQKLEKLSKERAAAEDDLDSFMSNLSNEKSIDKAEIRKLRMEVQQLKTDQTKLQRLINIARPIDLPPLQTLTSPETAKSKVALPLYGKRNTLKLSTTTSVIDSINSTSSDLMEEHDEEAEEEQPNAAEKPILAALHSSPVDVHSHTTNEKNVDELEQLSADDSLQNLHEKADKETQNPVDSTSIVILSNAAKKRRNRIRLRGERGRENVDFDDSEEVIDTEKYSTWLPPDNQTGDGSTNLNDKYGY